LLVQIAWDWGAKKKGIADEHTNKRQTIKSKHDSEWGRRGGADKVQKLRKRWGQKRGKWMPMYGLQHHGDKKGG